MPRSFAIYIIALVVLFANTAKADQPVTLVVGESQFFNADHIRILSVISSGKGFEVGAKVTVEGVYTLNSVEAAHLGFYSTQKLKPGENPTATQTEKTQYTKALRGEHTFKLSKVIKGNGNPHLTFYHTRTGKPFGGVYFGNKSNVLMKKGWSYHPPARE